MMSSYWWSIWFQPKETLSRLLEAVPVPGVLTLAMISGIAHTMGIQTLGFFSPMLFVLAVLWGMVAGVIGLYAAAWLLRVTGRWLGGQATPEAMRVVMAWAGVPMVTLWFASVLLGALGVFVLHPWLYVLIRVVGSVWGFAILLSGLMLVQAFDVPKAFGNLALMVACTVLPVVLLVGFLTWLGLSNAMQLPGLSPGDMSLF